MNFVEIKKLERELREAERDEAFQDTGVHTVNEDLY